MFEWFEHTADLGIRVRAASLEVLFAEAAEALVATIVLAPELIEPKEAFSVRLKDDDLAYLLMDWLRELLYRFETSRQVFGTFTTQIRGSILEATAWGERLDPDRHGLNHEVKAITYHGLRLEKKEDTWLAEFIVDI